MTRTCSVGPLRKETVLDHITADFPREVEDWDKWDYKVFSPLSLDDQAGITVWLINRDETYQEINLVAEVN